MPSGIVIDLFDADDNVIRSVVGAIDNDKNKGAHVVAIRSTNENEGDVYENLKTRLMEYNVWIHSIARGNKLRAFYEAKVLFDKYQIRRVAFYCRAQSQTYWQKLVEFLLTPIHIWNFEPQSNADSVDCSLSDLEQEVQSFLDQLPAIGEIKILKSSLIPGNTFIHGFTTRFGGISAVKGMQSLCLTYSAMKTDALMVIESNRRRLAKAVGFDAVQLSIARTVHGNCVHVLGEDLPQNGFDAIVTNKPGCVVGAPAADCLPFLFADPVQKVCGAAHAGWKGTLMGVVAKTIDTMSAKFGSQAQDILVSVGPSIQSCCFDYDLDDGDITAFKNIKEDCVLWKHDHPKPFINLQAANRAVLLRAGILAVNIDDSSVQTCTCCSPDRFFSFQRDGVPFGNQIGFIGIKP